MIIIKRKYIPTDASVVRTMALIRGLDEQNVPVSLFFLMNNEKIPLPHFSKNVTVKCLSENIETQNKFYRFFRGVVALLNELKQGEDVFLASFIFPLFIFLSYKEINLYHERTEYPPFMFGGGIKGYLFEKIYIRRIKKTKGVFVISENLKTYFIERGIKESNVWIINMVVDLHRFDKIKKDNLCEKYIAYCGTISNLKDGVNDLIESFYYVHKDFPQIKLYILGRTPSLSDYIMNCSIITKYHLEDVIYMPGIISSDSIPFYLVNAEILVLARPKNEQTKYGIPTKLGEYCLTANPVILTHIGNIDRYFTDRKSCLFARPNDPKDFAEQIKWALNNPDEAKQIGLLGKKVACEQFNYYIEASKIKKIICN